MMHPLDWMARALCAVGGMPADAWTERPGDRQWGSTSDHKAAIRICKRCPVQVDCLEPGLLDVHDIKQVSATGAGGAGFR